VTDNGSLSVSANAALVGAAGMQAVLNDNNAIYITDDTPNAEPRYRARFYFDPNSIVMASGNAHYIFYGYTGASTVVLRVELRFSGGAYQLRAALLNDGISWTTSSWFTISDAPHFVELDWRAATAAGANNGGLTLWIDDTQRANLTGIDNDTRRIDRARLGATAGVDTGTRGTYYFDAFESRKSTYIGPVASPPLTNLALNRATASADNPQFGNTAPQGNDGSTVTRWVARNRNASHWWKVDLGAVRALIGSQVVWQHSGRVYKYRVEVSTNNITWMTVADKTNNASTVQTQTDHFTTAARYVRITITGLQTRPTTWASFYEFRVMGYL
jgi:hypothetical protein